MFFGMKRIRFTAMNGNNIDFHYKLNFSGVKLALV